MLQTILLENVQTFVEILLRLEGLFSVAFPLDTKQSLSVSKDLKSCNSFYFVIIFILVCFLCGVWSSLFPKGNFARLSLALFTYVGFYSCYIDDLETDALAVIQQSA